MNKIYNNKLSRILGFGVLFVFMASCNSMLDQMPQNERTREEFWQTRDDVESSLLGAYNQMQDALESLYVFGELRGDLIGTSSSDYLFLTENLLTENQKLVNWSPVYSVINRFNMVYRFAPQAQLIDITYSATELSQDRGEALACRAFMYFYLARTYKDMVYNTEPSENDEQDYKLPPVPYTQVLDSVIVDLRTALRMVRSDWDGYNFPTDDERKRYQKGRINKASVRAMLADALITRGRPADFNEAIGYCNDILEDQVNFAWLPGTRIMEIFYPGNSSESIFELQHLRGEHVDIGPMYRWYNDKIFYWQLNATYGTLYYWQGEESFRPRTDDLRGFEVSFQEQIASSSPAVWKFLLASRTPSSNGDRKRQSNTSDAINYIFYRLSDVYFMKAEAQANTGDLPGAIETLKIVRDRAIPSPELRQPLPEISANNIEQFEAQLLDEKAREVGGEGKRWFDLVRIARRSDNADIIIDRIAMQRSVGNFQFMWRSRLSNPNSWFFPIHRNELNNNKFLVQNPYYIVK